MNNIKHSLYFNEKLHKYTNQENKPYTSVTQVIGRYEEEFDKEYWSIAKAVEEIFLNDLPIEKWNSLKQIHGGHKGLINFLAPNIKDEVLVRVKTRILEEWRIKNKEACDKGNIEHNFLEDTVNISKGIKVNTSNVKKLFTIANLLEDDNYKELDITVLEERLTGKHDKILRALKRLISQGYRLYAEIAVYNEKLMVAGLVDLLAYNPITKDFKIIDWKTNEKDIRFTSGYYRKENGIVTDEWVQSKDYLKYPLSNIHICKGMIYTLQLSQYAYLIEKFGLTCTGLYLFHIRDTVEIFTINYLKEHVLAMLKHFYYETKV